MLSPRAIVLSMLVVLVATNVRLSAETPVREPDFESDIQPILAAKCGHCHSDRTQKGELNLSSIAGLRRGGESGDPAIGAELDESPLWNLVEGGEMPPEGKPGLSEDEKQLLKRWIETVNLNELDSQTDQPSINQHDILPIVLLRCVTCHGPQRRDGNLDMRSVAAMLEGGESGPAVIPGKPDQSPMIQKIESESCPPSHLLLKFFVRRPSKLETETLRKWISAGAPVAEIKPDVASSNPDPLVTEEDREHWAFQPIKVPPVVALRSGADDISIDHFIGAKLSDRGLSFSPEADRDTLIRRACIDLIGMPPSSDQWHQWRTDSDPNWYRSMIDDLLDSPHYGERWGRYWLDLAGYADSEGGISADPMRPVAWKYRDYVIDAFNQDKPYDRFLLEQLAGDELIDYQNAPKITDEMVDNLVATGFLRMGIDETGSRTMNFVPERLKVVSDAIEVVTSSLMGLTMECARCHSHKYDPIPQRDYYRFKAIFQGALDEHDWHSFKTRKLMVGTDEQRKLASELNPTIERKIKKLQAEQKSLVKQVQLDLIRFHYPQQSEDNNQRTIKALKVADNNRTLPQRNLVEKLQRAEVFPDEVQPLSVLDGRQRIKDLSREVDRLRRQMAPTLQIRALWDSGRPSPTYILQRGEHNKAGRLVGPGVPSVLTDGKSAFDCMPPFPGGTLKTGRRLAFARWLTRDDHPLTSRVMVNRIWHYHFGRGIVADLDNFGVMGSAPTHPELLDWLAGKFVAGGWSIKQMHRLIMNSRTYRQSSRVTEQLHDTDPQNRLVSRMSLRRLDAESLRDSLLFASGKLDRTPGGLPDTVSVDRDGLVSVNPTDDGLWRRSVYLQYRRTEIPTMMDTFDYPPMGPNCLARNVSTLSPQALLLLNNRHVRWLSRSFAARVMEAADNNVESRIQAAYVRLLSRRPSEQERELGRDALTELTIHFAGDEILAFESYCHSLMNSAAFLYVD